MPREIMIKATCERCDLRAQESPATRSFVLGLKEIPWVGDRVPQSASPTAQKVIEACETCAKELDEWIETLADHGILISELIATPHRRSHHRTPAQRRAKEEVICTAPNCGASLTRSGLIYHAENTHKIAVRSAAGPCPEGCGYESESASAMGNHRAATHGFDAIEWALERLAQPRSTTRSPQRGNRSPKSS